MTKALSSQPFQVVLSTALFFVPFKNIVTKELKLALFVARLGFLIGCLLLSVSMLFALYEVFYAVTKVTWFEGGVQRVERGLGLTAFAAYLNELVLGVFITLTSSLLAVLISIASKMDNKNTQ